MVYVLDFVKDNRGRLVNLEQSHDGSYDRQYKHDGVVRRGEKEHIIVLDSVRAIIIWLLDERLALLLFRGVDGVDSPRWGVSP
jgi:hypothetical protein